MKKVLSFLLCLVIFLSLCPQAEAAQLNTDLCPDLSAYIRTPARRTFVEQTVGYHLRHDETVRKTLEEGYCAIFFFEGCSDNMEHPEYRDVSYYRISAACLGFMLDDKGDPQVVFYNDNCSTLPDRPTEYGPRKREVPADVGPATVRDGTYEAFSVLHRGSYEALNLRNYSEDAGIPAIYMTPHGYTRVLATGINIHTRTVNHILKHDMWSEGCILVGAGEFEEFTALMENIFYRLYDSFDLDLKVGCVTINRQYLKDQLYDIYKDRDAVDFLLASSRPMLPQKYLERCGQVMDTGFDMTLWASEETQLMSLPCSNETDARSVCIKLVEEKEEWAVPQAIVNTRGATWFVVEYEGQTGYLYARDFYMPTGLERFWRSIFG